jgi:Lrp/AsnC family transcriptional regulator for asnA, asnC and gidA
VNLAEQTSAPSLIELDEIDQAIIEHLREDGRMPYRALAEELDLTQATIRARVKRLEESGTMRVVAVTDIEAAGYDMLLAIGVQVENRAPEMVARDLAAFPEVFSVNVVVGAQDVEMLVVTQDQAALDDLINRRLANVPGVRRLTPALALDVLKNQPDWVPFHEADRRLDSVDEAIVGQLSRDARVSNRQIAEELGVTEGTVRGRIKRMEEEKQIRITAVTNIDRFRDAALAYIWIEVENSGQTREVARALAQVPELGFVGVMLGRSDILAITMVRNTEHLAEFIHKRVSSIEGVRRTESTLGVNFIKHDYRMARIVN